MDCNPHSGREKVFKYIIDGYNEKEKYLWEEQTTTIFLILEE